MELQFDNLNITRQQQEQEKQSKSLEQLYRNTQQTNTETDSSAKAGGVQKQESLISLPKGGGAVSGVGEKFQANPVTGTANITIPIAISPGRNKFTPQLALSYDSGSGNSPFGLGWNIGLPSISRKTSKGLPKYIDNPNSEECDTFLLSGAEDLVPFYEEISENNFVLKTRDETIETTLPSGAIEINNFIVVMYRPRIEGLFAKIERHRNISTNETFWKTVTKENITTYYGSTSSSRISHPDNPLKVFQWLIDKTEDGLGNIMIYEYIPENSHRTLDETILPLHEKNRHETGKSFNQKYLKSVFYGNKTHSQADEWLFRLVFDYGENFEDIENPQWYCRPDAFSTFNAGFEIRTYRLCKKILMYHHFEELGVEPVLVKSTDLDFNENPVATQLKSVKHTFYSKAGVPKSLPPVEFTYSEAIIDQRIHNFEIADLKYIPAGLDGSFNQWVDINDEGISGILTETLNGWYYMENLGDKNYYNLDSNVVETFLEKYTDTPTNGEYVAGYVSGFEGITGWDKETYPEIFFYTDEDNLIIDISGLGTIAVIPNIVGIQTINEFNGSGFGGTVSINNVFIYGSFKLSYTKEQAISVKEKPKPEPHFGLPRLLHEKPSLANISQGIGQLTDIDGDGKTELMILQGNFSGYYEKDTKKIYDTEGNISKLEDKWSVFKPFKQMPNINMQDPNLKFIDISGDGHADILITEDNCFICYESKAKDGYKSAYRTIKSFDEEKGPAVIFSNPEQSVYLADMNGDGLTDIVRIRNGQVCYWANMGYGRFSEKITLDNSPRFDYHDKFNQNRIRLADVDGSGTVDIIYLGDSSVKYYKNLSGNAFADMVEIKNFPQTDNIASVSAFDLLGNGTACLVWSSPLPSAKPFNVRFMDLMSGTKPYLLTAMTNNMGAESKYTYAPSTKFYLRAKRNLKPWITKLPFPVQVLEKVTVFDYIQDTQFSTRYAYNHGYFDPQEREFRGFGMVEQWDTELFTNSPLEKGVRGIDLDQPPVYTKTWFHNGAYINQKEISQLFEKEYFAMENPQGFKNPVGLNAEAARALKGRMLRSEVYALDNNPVKEKIPYTVTQQTYTVQMLQPKLNNKFEVYLTTESETISIQLERSLEEPRISHKLVLKTDKFGNQLKVAQIAYPRNLDAETDAQQKELVCTVTETAFINEDNNSLFYRHSVPYQTKLWQLVNLENPEGLQNPQGLKTAFDGAAEEQYLDEPTEAVCYKKILDYTRNYFYDSDCTQKLGLGEIAAHGLPYQLLQAVFNNKLVEFNNENFELSLDFIAEKANYIENEGYTWKQSERQLFNKVNFYLPFKKIDPFGNETAIVYDNYNLLISEVIDALENIIEAGYNYSFLQPYTIADQNGNLTTVEFDAFGVVNKLIADGNGLGDTPEFPTERYEYNIENFKNLRKPNFSHTIKYTEHSSPLEKGVGGIDDRTSLHSYTYFSGTGQTVMQKIQAEPDETGTERWIGTGRTTLNNKAKPVKQYEPYFSETSEYESEPEIVKQGVTPVLYYDPLGRLIRTDLPDGTYTKVEFTPWQQTVYDPNDTVTGSIWYNNRLPENNPTAEEERAATLAANHANTPQVIDFDTLGRPYRVTDDNGFDALGTALKYSVTIVFDVKGNKIYVEDAKRRPISQNTFDMAGRLLRSENIGSGVRMFYYDTADKPIVKSDSREHILHFTYDELQRPLETIIRQTDLIGYTDVKLQQTVYGTNSALNNIGQIYQICDQSGLTTFDSYDFKGNLLQTSKKLTVVYNSQIDWNTISAVSDLQSENFVKQTTYDALNRIVTKTEPDGSVTKYFYNTGGLLEKVDFVDSTLTEKNVVTNIDYNARRQRSKIEYGNGTGTLYLYDDKTFRLKSLTTKRNQDTIQDLKYFYDPVGNIVQLNDDAQQTVYFNNSEIEAKNLYEYDAVYRLVKAEGRELIGLNMPTEQDFANNLPLPNDNAAMQNYTHNYKYDELGNILNMNNTGVWNRDYIYNSFNQLTRHYKGQMNQYEYDTHGNTIRMPHLPQMKYDYLDQLNEVALDLAGNKAYYNYDFTGTRTRKTIVKSNITEETIYFGDYEIFRKFVSGTLDKMIETNHISEGKQKICTVDKTDTTVNYRYQLTNHLGSSCIELDENGNIISFEEYHPFGTTSYRSGRSEAEVSLKRYKYVMKELDNETGLYYYGMRYYAPWLARFVSLDPLQVKYPQYTPYQYAGNKPVTFIDLDGLEEVSNYEYNNTKFIVLQNVSFDYVLRDSKKSFTETAISNDKKNTIDYTINGQQFDKVDGAKYYQASDPQPTNQFTPQGYIIDNEEIVAGRSSDTFYFAQFTKESIVEFGFGNPPEDYNFGFGGGIPLCINGLKYGETNIYSEDAPSNLPIVGNPGVENNYYLLQRSNAGYPEQNSKTVGKSIIGYNDSKDMWIIVSQENGVEGMTLDEIRDYLVEKGYYNILAFDGSSSALLVKDKSVITNPTKEYKDNTIPAGLMLSVPNK